MAEISPIDLDPAGIIETAEQFGARQRHVKVDPDIANAAVRQFIEERKVFRKWVARGISDD
jgi:hypothetical protein